MFSEIRSFSDPQQHASSILGWQQVYDQLSCGRFSSELQQISAARFQIFQESLDKRIVQRGCAPKGRLCIAISLSAERAPKVQGHEVGTCNLVLLRGDEEFLLHAPEGTRFFGANVDVVRFAKLAAFELSAEKLRMLQTMPQVINVSANVLQRVHQQIYPLFGRLLHGPEVVGGAAEKLLEDTLLEVFLDLFSNASDERRGRSGSLAVSAYLVKRSQELALANSEAPPSILDLCEQLRVSRRTLQNSFQAVTGIRPLEYLRNLRLNAVRRRLIATSATEFKVGEIAGEMGFYHLSHFAGNYRELFGECPSHTRRLDR